MIKDYNFSWILIAILTAIFLIPADALHQVMPVDPSVTLSTYYLALASTCIVIFFGCCAMYSINTLWVKASWVAALLSVIILLYGKPVSHYFMAIDKQQYKEIKLLINDKPEYIAILPNYVDENCEMNLDNYERYKNLLVSSKSSNVIGTLHIHQSIIEVKKMCASTVWNNS